MFLWWYVEAEDFSDSRVSGRYVLQHDGVTQRLTLKDDHTFTQEDNANGIVKRANGTWRVFSHTGHVAFSSSFIDACDVYGVFKNYFGVVSLTFDSGTSVKAYKKLFS